MYNMIVCIHSYTDREDTLSKKYFIVFLLLYYSLLVVILIIEFTLFLRKSFPYANKKTKDRIAFSKLPNTMEHNSDNNKIVESDQHGKNSVDSCNSDQAPKDDSKLTMQIVKLHFIIMALLEVLIMLERIQARLRKMNTESKYYFVIIVYQS